ncbi:MAG: phosphatidylglycerol lysyltransferase domain-containing protein [Tannerellaceae bacterium]|nr:phosphatidylglycerol lysyltransferase domain-containing protein [Tannerellaceae bacterium]
METLFQTDTLVFRPITLADKELITSFTYHSEYQNCDFAFANMCSWRFLYNSEFAVKDDFLFIRFFTDQGSHPVYMCPVGKGRADIRHAIRLLEQEAVSHDHKLWILGITNRGKEEFEAAFPDGFKFLPERDYFDYIYLREDLVGLTGKKYQPKRNHINKFKKNYSYTYLSITPELVPHCLELEHTWYKANHTEEDEEDLSHERRSLTYALTHFEELGLTGGALCVENEIVAFSFGSPINYNTFGIHVEKADIRFDGAYSMINREFAARLPEQYIYLNREEDLGIPGLRQAKQSYQPLLLLEKYTAIKK